MKLTLPALIPILTVFISGCQPRQSVEPEKTKPSARFSEVSELYTKPAREIIYSESVRDTFHLFSALPNGYNKDTTRYPLILLLDANAYMEAVVAELSLARITQGLPKCIIIGIGYKDFWAMDSLRARDYTVVPDKEYPILGGAAKFESFINDELIPDLKSKYRFEEHKLILMGHSLGGTFGLHYLFNSATKGSQPITNIISVSPPIEQDDLLIFEKENQLNSQQHDLPFKLYVCLGSMDRDTTVAKNPFLEFKGQIISHQYPHAGIKIEEYGNFEHMDAAMPGFVKGLIFILGDSAGD